MQPDDAATYLKGVGTAKAKVLAAELDVHTVADLLEYFPFRYIDRTQRSTIAALSDDGDYVVLHGEVSDIRTTVTGKRSERLTCTLNDGTGSVQLVWFAGTKWVREKLKSGIQYVVMGKVSIFNWGWQMTHPEFEELAKSEANGEVPFLPVYNTTDRMKRNGLGTRALARITETMVRSLANIPDPLPEEIRTQHQLVSRRDALIAMHFPQSIAQLDSARRRMKYEELFLLQFDYQYARMQRQHAVRSRVFSRVGECFNRFYKEKLPFPLTGAQKRVIREIREDMRTGHQMNRLLQGDVGSGKTLVALMSMLLAIDNGCQACLMAPTEILASQHYATFCRMLDGMNIRVELLTGSLKNKEKTAIREATAKGEVQLLIGTHALIEESVAFSDLGLVVIDEQHRFGVEQRSKLWTKSTLAPHILVMTATPIPRTLAMTLYGDLDCSVIDELPPGRIPVHTVHRREADRERVFFFLRNEIARGRQVYVVYPLIHESEKTDLKNLQEGIELMLFYFPRPQYQFSIVHGQLPPDEKAYAMERFKRGETNIMVATTVIEVGVDVPNATVMIIENAERFGLSQLHQLRGRVGRGGGKAYCILMTKDTLTTTSKERIRTMCSTTDGFKIAEADLKLRGPGDIQGLQQSGTLNLKVASIVDDEPIVAAARNDVRQLLENNPTLKGCEPLLHHIAAKHNQYMWGKIS
ncbi:MAG: ATP-dependent DNA helicase RecG [Bacteroidales bacterium]|nr:ATP-dependent DNA helicase RecG [Bacteroidales bacterium]